MAEKTPTAAIAAAKDTSQLALFPQGADSEFARRVISLRANPIPGNFGLEHLQKIHRALIADPSNSLAPEGINRTTVDKALDGPTKARSAQAPRSEKDVLAEFGALKNLRTTTRDAAVAAAAKLDDGLVTTSSLGAGKETAAALMVEQAMRHHGWQVNMFRDDGTAIQPLVDLSVQNRLTALRNEIRPATTPLRAIDFKRAMDGEISRAEAVSTHPELRGAFEKTDWAKLKKDPDAPEVQRTLSRVQRDLGNGVLSVGAKSFELSL